MTRAAVGRPCCAGRTAVTVSVSPPEMADWLVRSALPDLSAIAGFADRGDWFRSLPQYDGHTSSGQIRGWAGALSHAAALRDELHQMWWRGVKAVQGAGIVVRRGVAIPQAEVILAGKRELAPSALGPVAHQAIARAIHVGPLIGQFTGDYDASVDLVQRTWHTSLHALADRALVRELEVSDGPMAWPGAAGASSAAGGGHGCTGGEAR